MIKKNKFSKKLNFGFLLAFMFFSTSLLAQNIKVTGVVTDGTEPLIGVSVSIKNTSATNTSGAITGIDGDYTIEAPSNATLIFRYIGFDDKEVQVNGRSEVNVSLKEDVVNLSDVVIVGYGTQKKVTLSGAVAGLKGESMIQTKNENPQNMLTGKISGVRVWQKSAEPGSYSANFDIRGMGAPLIIIDGIPREIGDFQRLNPADIDDISVLKDGSAAIYGVRSANGVVLVTTKRGQEGKVKVSYSGSYTIQKPNGMPKLMDAYETMTIYNERYMNNINGGAPFYSEADFEAFRNGTRRTTDWNKLMISKTSPQTQHDMSISGGSDKVQFYVGLGYNYQQGIFASKDLNYDKFNLRSTVTAEIVKGLKAEVNLAGMADQQNSPYTRSLDLIGTYWALGVLQPAYADPDNTLLNYQGIGLENNPISMMTKDVSGYNKKKQKTFQSTGSLTYDFETIMPELKGLSVKLMASYDYRSNNNTVFRKEYSQYAYNEVTGGYDAKKYDNSSPSINKREFFDRQQILSQILLNYNRVFDKVHSVGATMGWETQKNNNDNFYAQRYLAFPVDNLLAGVVDGQIGGMNGGINNYGEEAKEALIGRFNYDYDSRYIAEFQFRRDGSSRFHPDHRWGFFPSASAAWRLSEEPFFKKIEALSFVNQLKFRGSYGVLGDDLADDWNYAWLPGYVYPATNGNWANGYYNEYAPGYILGGDYVTAMAPKSIANEYITWYKSKTFNVGVDFDGWNGLFGFTLDYFNRKRTGIFQANTAGLPTVVGAAAPIENANSDRQFGMELELRHRNKIQEVSYGLKGIVSVTRKKYLRAVQNGNYKNSYDKWRHDNLNNRYQGVQWGYKGDGRFQNWNDIWSYNIQKGNDVLPGDYKYQDWNGDGQIDGLDEHPFAYDQTPYLNYSLNIDAKYRNFDLNVLFQGSALGSMQYQEPLYAIWGENGGGALEQFLDRWHPKDPTADPYDPATEWYSGYYAYTGHYPEGNSTFNRVSTAYLRLKSLELGYTLPKIKNLELANLRVFFNAYNLLTITSVKFVDPEHPDEEKGRLYPLNKTYTFGLSLTF